MIRENLHEVEERICAACARSGRSREEVTLIAVSKTKPVGMIREAAELGQLDFGENKPQEIRDKYPQLPPELRWHMIGNLQRNKIKYIIDKVCMIHSVSSPELAQAIEKEAARIDRVIPVLLEVNIAGEASKGGIAPGEALETARLTAQLPHLRLKGLMCVPPFVEIAEENRVWFANLRKLAIDIAKENIDNVDMCELSMGMTGDFEVAIEEGATMVRVGTGIFGARV